MSGDHKEITRAQPHGPFRRREEMTKKNADDVIDLTLFCLVDGDSLSEAFEVEISSAKTVSALKKAIRDDNTVAFAEVDAKMLILWCVSIPKD